MDRSQRNRDRRQASLGQQQRTARSVNGSGKGRAVEPDMVIRRDAAKRGRIRKGACSLSPDYRQLQPVQGAVSDGIHEPSTPVLVNQIRRKALQRDRALRVHGADGRAGRSIPPDTIQPKSYMGFSAPHPIVIPPDSLGGLPDDEGLTRQQWQQRWGLSGCRAREIIANLVRSGAMVAGFRMVERNGCGMHKTPVYRLNGSTP